MSEIGTSLLVSPKPEDISNIPKPQSGLGPVSMSRKSIPILQHRFEAIDKFTTPERTKSSQRVIIQNRFEKLDIVSYKEKRTEYRNKNMSRVRDEFESGKTLLTELNAFESKRNIASF